MSHEPINGYCRNIEVGDLKDCDKIIDGRCTVYASPCHKVGRQGNIGCAFSPLERLIPTKVLGKKKRVGQQKQVGKWRTYNNSKAKKRSRN